jgi:hypothetical protein
MDKQALRRIPVSIRRLFLVRLVAFLKNLRIDVGGAGTTAFGNIAGNIHEFTLLFAGRAGFRGRLNIYGIATIVALKNSHVSLLL